MKMFVRIFQYLPVIHVYKRINYFYKYLHLLNHLQIMDYSFSYTTHHRDP